MDENIELSYQLFDSLIARYYKLIRYMCWRLSHGNEPLFKQLVQDSYVSIWCHLSSLRRDSPYPLQAAWVVFQCRSAYSHNNRSNSSQIDYIDTDEAASLPASDDNEQRELIDHLAVDLNPVEHQVLDLLLQGYTYKEIAQQIHCSTETVKKTRQRIIVKMKQASERDN